MRLFINLDISPLMSIQDNMKPAVERAMKDAARRLTTATHAHILEEVQAKLRSTRQKYIDALSYHQASPDTWIISLEPQAFFIEDGMPQHEMIDDLLKQGRPNKGRLEGTPKGQVKTAKDGSKFRVIPFEHGKGPTAQTPFATSLTNMVKAEMRARKIPYGNLEKDASGKPKLGLLHAFNVADRAKGAVPVSKVGIPLLQGVRIYQRELKDKQGKAFVKKAIMTFRVVSSKHKGTGRWTHPGLTARKFMNEAYEWALKTWEQEIAPDVLRQIHTEL